MEEKAEISTPTYLAIDPGETNGYAIFDQRGRLLSMGQFRHEELTKELTDRLTSSLKTVIVEEFKKYAHAKSRNWKEHTTSEVIGKIEMLAELRGVSFVKQPASVYPIGARWGGFEIPSNHSISHQFCAAAHGYYYLTQTAKVLQPGHALLQKRAAEDESMGNAGISSSD